MVDFTPILGRPPANAHREQRSATALTRRSGESAYPNQSVIYREVAPAPSPSVVIKMLRDK